jgi:uncharacterized protein
MNTKIKDYLGIAGIITVLLVGFSVVSYVRSYANSIEPASFRSFTVNGTGKIAVVPDVAEFSFSVITQGGKDLGALQKDNTTKINKILNYVKGQGVSSEDIETTAYNVEPRYQYASCSGDGARVCPPPSIVGYTITQSVQVKVREDKFAQVGDLLSGVVTQGANNVSQLTFTIDDPAKAQAEAKAKAIEKARAQAKVVAAAGGFRVGKLLSIDENVSTPMPFAKLGVETAARDALGSANQSAPTIEAGSQDVTVTVNLRYEIK